MKQFNVFLATLALTCFSLMPAAANADDLDDLDVTMEVVDDAADITDLVSEMRGPDRDGAREGDDVDDDESDDDREDGSDDDREDGLMKTREEEDVVTKIATKRKTVVTKIATKRKTVAKRKTARTTNRRSRR